MYDYFLETKMQDEIVKECMIRWAQNIGHNIDIDQCCKYGKITYSSQNR